MTHTQRLTLAASGLGLFMIFLDALIVNVGLPAIQADFGVGEAGLQWVVAAYSIGMAVFIMSSATLADLHGRRRLFMVAIAVFSVASLICGLATNIFILNIARGFQGIAAGAVNVTSLALVSAAFPEAKSKARAIGIWTAIASVAPAIGPTLGGFLVEEVGWRSIFLVNIPVGVAVLFLTARYVGESRGNRSRSLDLGGQALFIVAVGAFAYALIEGPQTGWLSVKILGLFAFSVVSATAFVLNERRNPNPMMDLNLFNDRTYSLAICTIFVVFLSIYGMLILTTQYFQNVRAFSPVVSGLLILPFSGVVTVISPMIGKLVGRVGFRPPILMGLSSLIGGLLAMMAGFQTSIVLVAVGLLFVGIGAALCLTPITSLSMSSAPVERAGMASGIMSAQRALGSTVGFAVLGSILAAWLAGTLDGSLQKAVPDPTERRAVAQAIIASANPRAHVAEMGPARPISHPDKTTLAAIVKAADGDFIRGIQVALALAIFLLCAVLSACAAWLPRGAGALREAGEEAKKLTEDEGGPD